MSTNGIRAKLEEFCEALVFAEPANATSVSDLQRQLEEVIRGLEAEGKRLCAEATRAALQTMSAVAQGKAGDPVEVFAVVGKTISLVESVLRDGREITLAEFPPELDLGKMESLTGPQAAPAPPSPQDGSEVLLTPVVSVPFVLPPIVDETIFADFLARQDGVMEELDGYLLELEQSASDEALNSLRRLVHTLKGEAGLLGMNDVEHLCHATEDALDQHPLSQLVDVLFQIKDWLTEAFNSYAGGVTPGTSSDGLLNRLQDPLGGNGGRADKPSPILGGVDQAAMEAFLLDAAHHLEEAGILTLCLESKPGDMRVVEELLRHTRVLKEESAVLSLTELSTVAEAMEELAVQMKPDAMGTRGEGVDALFDCEDWLKGHLDNVAAALATGKELAPDAAVQALVARAQAIPAVSGSPNGAPAGEAFPPTERLGDILRHHLGVRLVLEGVLA